MSADGVKGSCVGIGCGGWRGTPGGGLGDSTLPTSAYSHTDHADQGRREGLTMLRELSEADRLTQLKALRDVLAAKIDTGPGARDLAGLSRQYRDTLREIEEIQGAKDFDDEISEILAERG